MAASGESARTEPSGSLGELIRRAGSRFDAMRTTYNAGELIAERYRLLTFVGSGGMGEVWRAEQIGLERVVAIKLLRAHRVSTDVLRARLVIEARAATRVDHPGSVTVHDVGIDDAGSPYIVMEFLRGYTLASYLDGRRKLSPRLAVDLAIQLAQTLRAAHAQGVVHRDLKPENVVLSRVGGRLKTTILDFGLAKILADVEPMGVTRSGQILGSPPTMSPEQIRGQLVDGRADVYALGCVLYWMLEGKPPFVSADVAALLYMHANDAPPAPVSSRRILGAASLEDLLIRSLAKASGDRPTAAEFVQRARGIDLRRGVSHRGRGGRRAWVAVATLVACGAVIAVSLNGWDPSATALDVPTPAVQSSGAQTRTAAAPPQAPMPQPATPSQPSAVSVTAAPAKVRPRGRVVGKGRVAETSKESPAAAVPIDAAPAPTPTPAKHDWFDREFTRYGER